MSAPCSVIAVENALDPKEIDYLVNFFTAAPNKWRKSTGPLTLEVSELIKSEFYIQKIDPKILSMLGPCEVVGGTFFEITKPHIIHNDGLKNKMSSLGRVVLLPLAMTIGKIGDVDCPAHLILFDQFYRKQPIKLFFGSEGIESPYNEPVYDHQDVENLSSVGIEPLVRDQELPHLQPSWIEGMSVHKKIKWTIGSMIAFESQRLHCSGEFRNRGITQKLGLSLFVELRA